MEILAKGSSKIVLGLGGMGKTQFVKYYLSMAIGSLEDVEPSSYLRPVELSSPLPPEERATTPLGFPCRARQRVGFRGCIFWTQARPRKKRNPTGGGLV